MKCPLTILLVVTGALAAAPATIPVTASPDSAAIAAQSCEGLQAQKLPDTTITMAGRVAAGGTYGASRVLSCSGSDPARRRFGSQI